MAEGEAAAEQHPMTPQEATKYVKGLAKHYGAVEVASPNCNPTRSTPMWAAAPGGHGTPIELNHRYAIAFTVEMDHAIVSNAPTGPGDN